jgi:hypothetical protein
MISNAVTAPLFDPHFQKKGLHIILKSFLRKAIVYYTHGALIIFANQSADIYGYGYLFTEMHQSRRCGKNAENDALTRHHPGAVENI